MADDNGEHLLPEIDRDFLHEKEFEFHVVQAGGELLLVLRSFDFPEAYEPRTTDLMIILPPGYPNANPDMFWTYPDVKLRGGAWPQASEHHQGYGDRNWQRWSRHFHLGWRPGIDSMRTYLAAIRKELAKGI